jgi:hypothetical protein
MAQGELVWLYRYGIETPADATLAYRWTREGFRNLERARRLEVDMPDSIQSGAAVEISRYKNCQRNYMKMEATFRKTSRRHSNRI